MHSRVVILTQTKPFLDIHGCVPPTFNRLTKNISHINVSVHQEFESGLIWWLGPRVSYTIVDKMAFMVATHLKG